MPFHNTRNNGILPEVSQIEAITHCHTTTETILDFLVLSELTFLGKAFLHFFFKKASNPSREEGVIHEGPSLVRDGPTV